MEKNITFKFTEKNFANPNQMQALTLAYIGDSIYDIMSREYVMKMMRELKNNLDTANDKVEIYQKIIKLNELKNQIDEKLFRVL